MGAASSRASSWSMLQTAVLQIVTEKGKQRHKRRTAEGAGGEGSPDGLRGSPDEWRKTSREVNEQKVMNGREGMEVLHRAESKDRPEWGRLKDAA